MSSIGQLFCQYLKPESGLFYYSDGLHSTEINFLPGNTLCVINTTYDIAMYESACGIYQWKEDTLKFEADLCRFLETNLQIDTLGCNAGEILIKIKTIIPFKEPNWRKWIKPSGFFAARTGDSSRLINLIALPEMKYKFSWSEIAEFDTLKPQINEYIKGPNIPIPKASCMNVEYPVVYLGASNNFYGYKYFTFSRMTHTSAEISINDFTSSNQFKYILLDPFGQ